jgi:heat shock protein 1/8
VSAKDKASGVSEKVTITSDKGRLSSADIARMVAEAEEHAEGDQRQQDCVEARNRLESYLYSLRTTVTDTLKAKLSAEEAGVITGAVSAALQWLDEHPAASAGDKEVFESKRAEVEGVANPILTKVYQAEGQSGGAGKEPGEPSGSAAAGEQSSEPIIEEVD